MVQEVDVGRGVHHAALVFDEQVLEEDLERVALSHDHELHVRSLLLVDLRDDAAHRLRYGRVQLEQLTPLYLQLLRVNAEQVRNCRRLHIRADPQVHDQAVFYFFVFVVFSLELELHVTKKATIPFSLAYQASRCPCP